MRLILISLWTVILPAGCRSAGTGPAIARGDCPIAPIRVLVSVEPWHGIVAPLAGDCAQVTTIVKGSAADPHDYEPTPRDAAEFEQADVVVLNGLGYDRWAEKAIATLDTSPIIVNAATVAGLGDGANPHIWYGPSDVHRVAAAISDALRSAAAGAADYFTARHAAWQMTMAPYDTEVARLTQRARGTSYGATEPVFDPMAQSLGMTDATPSGYRIASANESEPSPGDLAAFEQTLRDHGVAVLIDNTQTRSAASSRLRSAATSAGVAVLEVTESPPPDTSGFVEWQVAQLRALEKVLDASPSGTAR